MALSFARKRRPLRDQADMLVLERAADALRELVRLDVRNTELLRSQAHALLLLVNNLSRRIEAQTMAGR